MGAKDKKKWLMAGLLCLLMWLLCGCVGNNKMSIDTTLEVDDKFKGQREMSAVVSESVFRQAFDGNLEELQGMVTEKCPSTLICSAEEVNNGVAITMTLEFANLSDYTNKIGQILGKTPGIYFDASNSIFIGMVLTTSLSPLSYVFIFSIVIFYSPIFCETVTVFSPSFS